jgi:hypothetical protein
MGAARKLCTHRHWTACTTKLLVALGLAYATFPRLFYSRIRRPKPLCQSANPAAGKTSQRKAWQKALRTPRAHEAWTQYPGVREAASALPYAVVAVTRR